VSDVSRLLRHSRHW